MIIIQPHNSTANFLKLGLFMLSLIAVTPMRLCSKLVGVSWRGFLFQLDDSLIAVKTLFRGRYLVVVEGESQDVFEFLLDSCESTFLVTQVDHGRSNVCLTADRDFILVRMNYDVCEMREIMDE